MDDRLAELKRQRAAISAHLAWLDREIVAAEGIAPPSTPALPSTPPAAAPIAPAPSFATSSAAAPTGEGPTSIAPAPVFPEIDTRSIKSDVRRGCLVYIALGLVAAGMLVGLVYWRYG